MNEEAPEFEQPLYSATVQEDLAVGGEVGIAVVAIDEEGHDVRYSIDPGYLDGNYFSVSDTGGVVSLARSLDRDPPSGHDTFTFIVSVPINL